MRHGKGKPSGGSKWFTRKSRNAIKGNLILPRADGTWYWQTDSNRSKRRKWLEKMSNRKIRRSSSLGNGNEYRKHYNLKRELD